MEGASILELVAELAIALLGFSGIVVALGERSSGALDPVERSCFFTMVLMGALVEVLALLPFALYYAGLESHTLWGWASGLAVVIALLTNRMLVRATPGATLRVVWADSTVSKTAVIAGYSSLWGSILLLALNATGILLARSFAPYLVAVLLLFGSALVAFVRMLNNAAGTRKPAPADPT